MTDPSRPDPPGTGSLRSAIGRVAGASAVAVLVGEVVTFAQTVALARLLSPAQIGLFAAGSVFTLFLGNFVEGGLRAALVQREGDLADAAETVFRATLVGGVLMSLAALATAPVVALVFDDPAAGLVAAATSGLLLLSAVTNVPEALLQREFSVRRRLVVGPLVSVTFAVTSVSLAALGWGVWAMVAGSYVSYVTLAAAVWWLTSWRPGRGRASVATWRGLSRYGAPLILGMLGSHARNAIEAVVVGRGLDTAVLGHFRYGQRIARIPTAAIIQVGSVSLFPAFSRIIGERTRMQTAYLRALHWTMLPAAAACGLMLVLGEPAVVVLFGERWRGAGVALMAMSGMSISRAVVCVSEEAIKASGRTRLLNWYTATEFLLGVGLLVLLVGPLGLVGASLSLTLTWAVVAVVVVVLAHRVVPVGPRQLASALATPMPGLLAAAAATWWLEHQLLRSDTRSVLLGVVFLALDTLVFLTVYGAVLSLFARQTVLTAIRTVRRLAVRLRRSAPTEPARPDFAAP